MRPARAKSSEFLLPNVRYTMEDVPMPDAFMLPARLLLDFLGSYVRGMR